MRPRGAPIVAAVAVGAVAGSMAAAAASRPPPMAFTPPPPPPPPLPPCSKGCGFVVGDRSMQTCCNMCWMSAGKHGPFCRKEVWQPPAAPSCVAVGQPVVAMPPAPPVPSSTGGCYSGSEPSAAACSAADTSSGGEAPLSFTIPDGYSAGESITIEVEGQQFQLTIPEGYAPGQEMYFEMPKR